MPQLRPPSWRGLSWSTTEWDLGPSVQTTVRSQDDLSAAMWTISRSQRVYLRQLLVLISSRCSHGLHMGMWRRRYGASLQVLKVEIGGDTQQLTQGASGEGPFRKHGPELIALTSSAQWGDEATPLLGFVRKWIVPQKWFFKVCLAAAYGSECPEHSDQHLWKAWVNVPGFMTITMSRNIPWLSELAMGYAAWICLNPAYRCEIAWILYSS